MLLADHANAKHEAWPSIDSLAARAECSRRSAQEHLQALEKDGEIIIVRNAGDEGCNLYRIVFKKYGPGETETLGVQNLHGGCRSAPLKPLKRGADQRRSNAPESVTNHQEPSEGEEERETSPRNHSPAPPLDPGILKNLKSCYPHATAAIVGKELAILIDVLPLLAELTADDWQALRAWNFCPKRIRGRSLWPRDRFEFLSHASEAVESVRRWWTAGGRDWQPQRRPQAPPPVSQPTHLDSIAPMSREEIQEFFKKSPITSA